MLEPLNTVKPRAKVQKISAMVSESKVTASAGNPFFFFSSTMQTSEIARFLSFVARGEQQEVEIMLRVNPKLALASGSVTDLSGRHFDNVTGFQYAFWVLDTHIWNKIIVYLSAEQLTGQWNHFLETNSEKYGRHCNFIDLAMKLHVYITQARGWHRKEREHYWYVEVGGAQRLVPAHVANEYCRKDQTFNPDRQFDQETLPRVRTVSAGKLKNDWFSAGALGQLGKDFAVARAGRDEAIASSSTLHMIGYDRDIVTKLFQKRMQERSEMIVAALKSTMQTADTDTVSSNMDFSM